MNFSGRHAATACAAALMLMLAAFAASAAGDSSSGAASANDPGAGLRTRLESVRGRLLAHYREIDVRSGLAEPLSTRLDVDEANTFLGSKPENASASEFWDWNASIVSLDESLVNQLATGSYHELAAVRGLDDIPMITRPAGLFAPCAVDVPQTYSPDKPAPLVVLLHAQAVSEASELAEPLFRGLASDTGAIVIAPFGRGDDLRSAPAAQDVYAALDWAEAALNVDRRRVFLVGDSLGGYAVFDVAPVRPSAWTALFAVRATMDAADQQPVKDALRGKTLYVVAGSADTSVNVDDVRRSVTWFRAVGLPTSYYEVPNAGHDIVALGPTVQRAWREMLAGVRSLTATPPAIPEMTPPPSQKP